MPVPPLPMPLEDVGPRPFSFFPPIVNIEHNEWLYQKANWSEVLVHNTRTGADVWVPRRFIGEVSRIEEPVIVVGLTKELEYKAGTVFPHARRVIEMPKAVNETQRPPEAPSQAPGRPNSVVGIRLESQAEKSVGRFLLSAVAVGVVACVVVISVFRYGPMGGGIRYSAVVQSDLPLTHRDDYFSVVDKLGRPLADRWRSERGELQYRLLEYPDLGLAVVLMGLDRDTAHYIGAVDRKWQVVHSVEMPNGQNSSAMLRGLKRF
ncbi:MAG: hypothetical protein K2X35_19495 [Bryobacteraceae bacterium]|nr:hypothetical protein [Bryobacteraceae bacterium]